MIKHKSNEPITSGWSIDRKINIFGTMGFLLAIAAWVWNISDHVAENSRDIILHNKVVDVALLAIKAEDAQCRITIRDNQFEIMTRLRTIEADNKRHIEYHNESRK